MRVRVMRVRSCVCLCVCSCDACAFMRLFVCVRVMRVRSCVLLCVLVFENFSFKDDKHHKCFSGYMYQLLLSTMVNYILFCLPIAFYAAPIRRDGN